MVTMLTMVMMTTECGTGIISRCISTYGRDLI